MSSSKPKKVHYERGTKGGHHRSSGSRDSGVGSSSASDRASLGTSPDKGSGFDYKQVEDQRRILSAVREALDAANERIQELEAINGQLEKELSDSHKENRMYKRQKTEMMEKIEVLQDDLKAERQIGERFRREAVPRTGAAAPLTSRSDKQERRINTSPARRETKEAPPRRHEDERPQANRGERRDDSRKDTSKYERTKVPLPPPSTNANPFAPNPSRRQSMSSSTSYSQTSGSYAPPSSGSYASSPSAFTQPAPPSGYVTLPFQQTAITYAPSPVAYKTAPPQSVNDRYPNDGKYHPHPL